MGHLWRRLCSTLALACVFPVSVWAPVNEAPASFASEPFSTGELFLFTVAGVLTLALLSVILNLYQQNVSWNDVLYHGYEFFRRTGFWIHYKLFAPEPKRQL